MKTKQAPKPTQQQYPREGLARVPAAAKFLDVSPNTIYRMVDSKTLPNVPIRDCVRIPWQALHEFVGSK